VIDVVGVSFETSAQVSAAVQELDDLANILRTPSSERHNILGLTGAAYRSWQAGDVQHTALSAPELVRRLSYALPLMRRKAAHVPPVRLGRGANRSRPMAN